jgi:hypothetical protein
MAEHMDYTGGGYASSGWPETGPPLGAVGVRHASGQEPREDGDGAPSSNMRDQIKDLTEQAREETVRLAIDAREQIEAVVRRRQEMVADRVAGVAAALRDAGRRLEREAARPAARDGLRPLVAGLDDAGAADAYSSMAAPPAGRAMPAVDAVTRGLVELAERAAGEVDRASRYLRRSELRDVVRDLEDLARRRPAAFVGGSFAAGLVLARFFKSSGRQPHEKLAGRH